MDVSTVDPKPVVTPEELSEIVGDVRELVRDLERRVSRLEQNQPAPLCLPAFEPVPAVPVAFPVSLPSDAIPSVGFGLLGIAGAYLLRALTEMGSIPAGVGVGAAIIYAAFWLWLAAQTPVDRRFTVAARVSTSVLILAPMLWESTVRFKALAPWAAASVILGFCVAAEAISWRKNLKIIARFVPAACALLAFALMIGTYALIPFTFSLLAICAAVEFAVVQNRTAPARWTVAAVADIAVLILTILMRGPRGLPEGYPPIQLGLAVLAQALLFVIYGISFVVETAVRQRDIRIPAIVQIAAALLLGAGGIVAITPRATSLGISLLACGAGCCAIASLQSSARNVGVYAIFGALLAASATWLLFSGWQLIVVWCSLAALVSFWRIRPWGGLGAAAFLWLALAFSGMAQYSIRQLSSGAGFFEPTAIDWPGTLVFAAAVFCYLVVGRDRQHPAASFLIVLGVTLCAAAWLAAGLRFSCSGTIVLSAGALLVAWTGARWKRKDLTSMTYVLMVAAAARIVTRDLQSATALGLVPPLLVFGGALIWLPRTLRSARETAGQ